MRDIDKKDVREIRVLVNIMIARSGEVSQISAILERSKEDEADNVAKYRFKVFNLRRIG